MSCPSNNAGRNQALLDAIAATTPEERMRHVQAFTGPIFEEARRRRAAGICGECDLPVVGGDDPIADSYCAEHAREVELEFLAFDQAEDARDPEP